MKTLEQLAREKCLAMEPTEHHQSYLIPRGQEDSWKLLLHHYKCHDEPYLHRVEDHTYVVFPHKVKP